jgi:hypothetical protein
MVEPKEFIKKRKELVKKITEQFWIRGKANKEILMKHQTLLIIAIMLLIGLIVYLVLNGYVNDGMIDRIMFSGS